MRKLTLTAIAAGTAMLGVAGYAYADHHRGFGKGQMIEQLDTDGDGQITKAEVEAMKASKFEEADANGDGGLTMEELDAYHEAQRQKRMEAMKQRMFERGDTNGDGVISLDEFEDRGAPMFERVDADDDGVITAEEIEAMKEKRGKHGWRHHRGPDAGPDDQ
ncbi:EF-hand domain-containing protein [Henriciella aquimarina]|uniref:EF-hand domain-containing protein n=1 Tax=Henriciella aquimarina TaxID=545261 RepID=UPI001F2A580D|nr:EF-hand domain-containing protein [Henriciella aquimarina]